MLPCALLSAVVGAAPMTAALSMDNADASVRRHVVIVGVNTSVDEGVAPLQYADDDAARFAELIGRRAASLHVLAVLDAETQRLFPDVAAEARPPTMVELARALDEAFADVRADRDAGVQSDFHFVFIGHGALGSNGEGYVSLLDGKLTRTALFERVLNPSPARFNHIIVDACAAYHLLYRGKDAVAAVQGFLEARSMASYPNTGVLLATTSARETHEWARIRGGVFSHEVLSALAGSADVDGDASLSYAEVGAFIEAANAGVDDPRARVDFTLRPPPLFLLRPLLTLAPRTRTLAFGAGDAGHFVIEDARGVAVAELNKNGEQSIEIELVGPAPFRVTRGKDEWRADDHEGAVAFASLARANGERVAVRSGVADALERGLFTLPFGKSYVAGYAARLGRDVVTEEPVASAPSGSVLAATSTAVVAGALAMGAAIAGTIALANLSSLEAGRGTIKANAAQDLTDDANGALLATAILGGGALVAGALSGALFLVASADGEP